MSSVLFRTSSGSITSSLVTSSPRFSFTVCRDSFPSSRNFEFSPKNSWRTSKVISETQTTFRLLSFDAKSHNFPEMLSDMEEESLTDGDAIATIASLKFALAFEDDGFGNGSGRDGPGFGPGGYSSGSNDNNEQNKIRAHYETLLELNLNDPLVLRNYGKFLHEIEGDIVRAEECYGRAILASPGDGELLSLYGKLIWDSYRDGDRAQCYFDQAISASPNDCVVMGSYAQFMWEAEEKENEESGIMACSTGEIMVGGF